MYSHVFLFRRTPCLLWFEHINLSRRACTGISIYLSSMSSHTPCGTLMSWSSYRSVRLWTCQIWLDKFPCLETLQYASMEMTRSSCSLFLKHAHASHLRRILLTLSPLSSHISFYILVYMYVPTTQQRTFLYHAICCVRMIGVHCCQYPEHVWLCPHDADIGHMMNVALNAHIRTRLYHTQGPKYTFVYAALALHRKQERDGTYCKLVKPLKTPSGTLVSWLPSRRSFLWACQTWVDAYSLSLFPCPLCLPEWETLQ